MPWRGQEAGDRDEMQRVLAEVASIGERITTMEKESTRPWLPAMRCA